ncbi:unnamed protein product [Rhizophagus irregularis]|uniref:Uncharacterized protein n=1 Tax=Rhizophagus irregularis TaxID=588596 RepID=A0A915Z0P9_9GLOM|nr:unnamed protein product [Rhizophagus irregularis]CAB5357945.1 unnamed protein product [Rhizophagus irregularis]
MASSSIEDNIIKSPTDDNNSTPVVNTSVAFADPSGSSSSNTTSKDGQFPLHLIPFIPDEPIYKGGLTYSKLSKKDKKNLQPLKVGSKQWIIEIEAIKAATTKKSKKNRIKLIRFLIPFLSFNGKTTTEIALYRDNLTIALTHYQNVCYDYHTYLRRQHSPIASSSLPPTKGKKKQKGRATDPDFNIKQLQILEETMDESGLHLALTVRHNKLYEPEYVTHQAPRQLKQSATRNFNLDLHYNLHMRKRFHHFTEDSALVTNFCSN